MSTLNTPDDVAIHDYPYNYDFLFYNDMKYNNSDNIPIDKD